MLAEVTNRTTVRLVAIALLLVAGVDLAIPAMCSSESAPLTAPPATAGWEAGSPLPADSPAIPLGDGGCFVCCSHVCPARYQALPDALLMASGLAGVVPQGDPAAFPRSFFHPPRP